MLWNIIQQVDIDQQRTESKLLASRAQSLEGRVRQMEEDLLRTRGQLRRLTELLEQRFGEDLDGDGAVGY